MQGNKVRLTYLSLFVALLLSGLATPVLKLLVQQGGHLGLQLENAISYCNVMFVGNLCSAPIVFLYYWPPNVVERCKRISREKWKSLLANTLLANILSPILIVTALEDAGNITTVILLLQTNAIFFALCSWIMFGERTSGRGLTGLMIVTLGVVVIVFLPSSTAPTHSKVCTIGAALCRALGSCLARRTLEDETIMPAFLLMRNLLGALGFFVLAIQMFGFAHFSDAFQPGFWQLMVLYGGLIVVLGQLTWFQAVSRLSSETISTWSITVPGLALFFAWLLVGDFPSPVEWICVILIVVGLAISKIKISYREKLVGPDGAPCHLQPFQGT